MNNKEAIKILNEIIDEGWLISDLDKCVAIDACEMATKALEQTEKTEELIYMLLNEADVEANKLKDSQMKYDIGFRDGINFIAHKLEALMKLIGKEKKE